MPTWKETETGYIGEGFGAPVELKRIGPRKWVLLVDYIAHPIASRRATFDHAERMLREILPGPKPSAPQRPTTKANPGGKNPVTGKPRPPLIVPTSRLSRSDPLATLNRSREDAIKLAHQKGVSETVKLLQQAQRELDARLRQVLTTGPGDESFTAAQLRSSLVQIRATLHDLRPGLKGKIIEAGNLAGSEAAAAAVRYMQEAQGRFVGINRRLPLKEATLFDRAVRGTEASILQRLEDDQKAGPGILTRYGDAVVERFEKRLQQRFLQGKPWADVRNELIADSPFLQQAPASWAERIVRTEVMGAHNVANLETMKGAEDLVGGMLKILAATFDGRTAADSYAVHGQVRRVSEPFEDWYHAYQHPPNRPNDREVVVPHNMAWPIPPELEPKSDAEVSARWMQEGRKGSPPRRPNMSTVPRAQIGTAA